MKLYGFATFNVSKCTLVAEFAGVAYDYVSLDPMAGEHKTPEHLRRHPLGKVPALELEDGRCLFESAAIARYLGSIGTAGLYGPDAWGRACVDQWIDYFNVHVGRWVAVFYVQEILRDAFDGAPVDQDALNEAQGFLDQQLPAVEKQLAEQGHLAGSARSIADPFAAALLQVHEVTSLDLGPYAAIQHWYDRLRAQDAYAAAMAHFPGGQLWH